MKLIVNCETGEQLETELTAKDIKQQDIDETAQRLLQEAKEADDAAKAQAKAALLDRLGITAEEAQLLLA